MGQEDDVHSAIAHVVLSCVAARGTTYRYNSYTHPGMHVNLFVHGVVGFLHYQSGKFNNDFGPAYLLSYKASKYLPLPCLMADLYRGNSAMCSLHLASGLLPFTLAITQQDNPELGNLLIACNIVSLCYYSFEHGYVWGWYTAGAAIFAYFLAPQMVQPHKVIYPLGLALMEYCAYRMFSVRIDNPPR
ncbi:hypothetical protein RR48_03603 [Papilio machaon]|uniref:Uncharacterized protein n=1 Tax=Papilio machaon TaxID=76193 RepID=A0A0N1I700_PAPMA|nr:uncharacterized protein LOC106717368 [Papilio machaon]KPJ08930.1 hypothetical protein RR48_03603 [Papilio machaon]